MIFGLILILVKYEESRGMLYWKVLQLYILPDKLYLSPGKCTEGVSLPASDPSKLVKPCSRPSGTETAELCNGNTVGPDIFHTGTVR